ncbi:MAG: Cobalamin-binding protein precursor [Methanosaeta sp. PtaU1.Bin060]|nr:MAG: Cobalamin-binding protein precursor [Methanosaeta sp. PtaU1.Bin060]
MNAHRGEEICQTKSLTNSELGGFCSPPKRVVTLTRIASELICIFGCIDRIVGRDNHSSFPPGLDLKPAVGSSMRKTISSKKVLDLDPDVVITGRRIPPEVFDEIESAGVPVVIIGTDCELEALMSNIRKLGTMMAAEKRAGELADFIERYASLITDRTGKLEIGEKPRVYNECAFGKYTTKTCTAADEGIALAGGVNIAHGECLGRLAVSEEWVIRNNPDIILSQISTMSPATVETLKARRDEILARPELKDTNAVRDGRVYISHLSVRRGPRMVGYLLYLAKCFHPELFEDINPDDVEREMLRKFYGDDSIETWAYPGI